jgi:diadenylate cyclase
VTNLLSDLSLLFQRINWLNILDIVLVTAIFFLILQMISDTKAAIILRGVIILAIFLSILTSLVNLPAFNWLIKTTLPALLLAVPVIFAPEIRRGLESIGRAGSVLRINKKSSSFEMQNTIHAVVTAAARLSTKNHGALIILQRIDNLKEYILTGVQLNARTTPELLLQIFYPNTPLHDGAVIIVENELVAAACVLPLSASGILNSTPDRQMGLRHRASLGISEATDAIAVVVSEETGAISVAHAGRMIRRLDAERLENILTAFYRPERLSAYDTNWFRRFFSTGKKPGVIK